MNVSRATATAALPVMLQKEGHGVCCLMSVVVVEAHGGGGLNCHGSWFDVSASTDMLVSTCRGCSCCSQHCPGHSHVQVTRPFIGEQGEDGGTVQVVPSTQQGQVRHLYEHTAPTGVWV